MVNPCLTRSRIHSRMSMAKSDGGSRRANEGPEEWRDGTRILLSSCVWMLAPARGSTYRACLQSAGGKRLLVLTYRICNHPTSAPVYLYALSPRPSPYRTGPWLHVGYTKASTLHITSLNVKVQLMVMHLVSIILTVMLLSIITRFTN